MSKQKNLSGMKFNNLSVIKEVGKDKYNQVLWECVCECGNTKIARSYDLTSGRTKSCGCIQREASKNNGHKNGYDLTGRRFGNLTVIKRSESKYGNRMWECVCDCGNIIKASSSKLISGEYKSCGCMKKERLKPYQQGTHHMTNTRLYRIWNGMKNRCYVPSQTKYEQYGGRGITVCDEWKNSFENFYKWAMENGYRDDLSIDRIDGDGNYEPGNCRWADDSTQNKNRTFKRNQGKKDETN